MYKTITSFVAITALSGCTSTLPSHDGSLHSVYGINSAAPEQAVTLGNAEPQQALAPVEDYEPTVQTISGSGVIASNPIAAIEIEPETQEDVELSANEPVETISTEPVSYVLEDYEHKLGAGETLFSVAGDLTGSSNNWRDIADYNSIADPGAITVGQSIIIPGELLTTPVNSESLLNAEQIIEKLKSEQESDISDPKPNIVVSANGTQEIESAAFETAQELPPAMPLQPMVKTSNIAVGSNSEFSDDATLDSKGSLKQSIANFASIIKTNFKLPKTLSPAANSTSATEPTEARETTSASTIQTAMLNREQQPNVNQSAVLQPNQAGQVNAEVELPIAPLEEAEQWVQVDGNFTPKAVYKGAGYTTGLLMRVSPGTKFKLTNKTDDWYEVETNQGAGYIFHRDILLSE